MKKWLATLWLVVVLPMTATAQQIPVKTIPVATGNQFMIFPSQNMSMGGVSIALDDPQGTQATEPFFQFLIDPVDVPDDLPPLRSGQRVVVRFEMSAKPLMQQWIRRIRQMVQQRFQM